MDFIEGLARSGGVDTILVVVGRLSKYGHFIGLKRPFTAPTVAEVFIREVVRLHGMPHSIISDRDKIFMSSLWIALFKAQGKAIRHSNAYHPQTDGQTEVVNRCLETYLHCFASSRPRVWSQYLHWAEYWYNTSFHTPTKLTPFQIVYGREPPQLLAVEKGMVANSSVEQRLRDKDETLKQLKVQLSRAQLRMKELVNGHRRDIPFEVGDLVYLKLRPYCQNSLAKRPFEKLSPRYYGSFEVETKIGQVSYILKLPPSTTIHPIFHVS